MLVSKLVSKELVCDISVMEIIHDAKSVFTLYTYTHVVSKLVRKK